MLQSPHPTARTGPACADRKSPGGTAMHASDYANPGALVDTDWVEDHRQDPNVRLIEVDVDTAAYDTGHIPGAVGWNWQTDLQRRPVRDIPTPDEWAVLLG